MSNKEVLKKLMNQAEDKTMFLWLVMDVDEMRNDAKEMLEEIYSSVGRGKAKINPFRKTLTFER